MAPCTLGREQLWSSAVPVVNNKYTLLARSSGQRTPSSASSPGCPGTAPVPTQPPSMRQTPRGKKHQAIAPWGRIRRRGHRGGGRRAALSSSCLKLALWICKVWLQSKKLYGSCCRTCQDSKIFEPAHAECWPSFPWISAQPCWVSGGDQLVFIHWPAQLGHSWLLCFRVWGVVKIQSTTRAAQQIPGVTLLA